MISEMIGYYPSGGDTRSNEISIKELSILLKFRKKRISIMINSSKIDKFTLYSVELLSKDKSLLDKIIGERKRELEEIKIHKWNKLVKFMNDNNLSFEDFYELKYIFDNIKYSEEEEFTKLLNNK